jgi:Uma2 family endonuclease
LEEHAEERRVDRGLTYDNLERMIREGKWQRRHNGYDDIKYRRWTIRVKLGHCIIGVATVILKRRKA